MPINTNDMKDIKRILVISLSNIGDVILTFPVLDILKKDFPQADISVMTSPKSAPIFEENPYLKSVLIYEKSLSFLKTIKWFLEMRKKEFDLIVDLRNTMMPYFLKAKFRTFPDAYQKDTIHKRKKFLDRLKGIYPYQSEAEERYAFFVPERSRKYVQDLLHKELKNQTRFVAIAAGAASKAKRWSEEGFVEVADQLVTAKGYSVVFVGDAKDRKIVQNVLKKMKQPAINLAGMTSLTQLGELLKFCQFAIVNDSGVMHLASYLNKPVVALFGPTDPVLYGPWSSKHVIVKKQVACPACARPKVFYDHICMLPIKPRDVLKAVGELTEK